MRDEGERARRQVLENAMKQLAKGVSAEDVLERLSIQLTNKLLHSPTRTLNKAGSDNSELIDAVAQIYHWINTTDHNVKASERSEPTDSSYSKAFRRP